MKDFFIILACAISVTLLFSYMPVIITVGIVYLCLSALSMKNRFTSLFLSMTAMALMNIVEFFFPKKANNSPSNHLLPVYVYSPLIACTILTVLMLSIPSIIFMLKAIAISYIAYKMYTAIKSIQNYFTPSPSAPEAASLDQSTRFRPDAAIATSIISKPNDHAAMSVTFPSKEDSSSYRSESENNNYKNFKK